MNNSTLTNVICLSAVILGIVFIIVAAIVRYFQTKKEKVCTYPVNATVIGMRKSDTSSSTRVDELGRYITYYPVFQYNFRDYTYKTESGVGVTGKNTKIGDWKVVYINPSDPTELLDPSPIIKWIQIIFGILGIVLVAAGIVIRILL